MDHAEDILQYNDIYAVVSTFQCAFTNRLIRKGKEDLFLKIRKHTNGNLCSILDYNLNGRYYEDIIFTVREPNPKNTKKIKKQSYNPKMGIYKMGWCADSEICYPVDLAKDEINVFIDHPPYTSNATSYVDYYYQALKKISRMKLGVKLNVFHQNNEGVIQWYFDGNPSRDSSLYVRANKVPWKNIIEFYRKVHVFCITHPESACLSAIEAAMCGTKLYIPKDRFNRLFIRKDLLTEAIPHSILQGKVKSIMSTFLKDLEAGFEREKNHKIISETNSWKQAVKNINEYI